MISFSLSAKNGFIDRYILFELGYSKPLPKIITKSENGFPDFMSFRSESLSGEWYISENNDLVVDAQSGRGCSCGFDAALRSRSRAEH